MTNVETIERIKALIEEFYEPIKDHPKAENYAANILHDIFSLPHFYARGCGHKDGEVLSQGSQDEIEAYLKDHSVSNYQTKK